MFRTDFVRWTDLDEASIAEWERLVESVQSPPDLSPRWAQALVAAHRVRFDEVEVFRLSDEAGLHALVPLRLNAQNRLGLRVLTIEPLNSIFSLHLDLLTDLRKEVCIAALLDAVDARYGHWSAFDFRGLVIDDPVADALQGAAKARGCAFEIQSGDASPFLAICSSWNDFLSTKSANFRSNIKRKARRLLESGQHEVRFVCEVGEVMRALDDVHRIEDKSWKASAGTSITSRPWERDFYVELAKRFGRTAQLLVTLAVLDSTPVAFDLTLLGGGRAYCLKTSFDAEYAELSVGMVLRVELMKRMFESGVKEYDFLGKSERYKLEWSETVRRSQSMRLFNSRSLAGFALTARSRLRAAARPAGQTE